jgi:hypothetical protein
MTAMSSIRGDLFNGFKVNLSAGYGQNVFQQVAGSGGHSTNATGGISYLHQTLSGSIAESTGNGLITNQGVVPVTTPGLVTNLEEYFSGRNLSAGYNNTMIKSLNVGVSWSKANSSNSGIGLAGGTQNITTEQYNGYLLYNFRKLNFIASAGKSYQGATGTTALPSSVVVYYFGVSRWFNFF